jgi:branched-subunit amino acid aminotransferase/4-amino-4-deoxychorismate lyase
MSMGNFRLYAVTEKGPQPLEVPEGTTDFAGLYAGLSPGVYSALRTFEHNKFLDLKEHVARTQLSMELLGWRYSLDEGRFRQVLHQVVTAFAGPNARVRFDVLAEPATQLGTDSRELIALMPFTPIPDRFYEEGVGVDFAPSLQRELARAKTADFAHQRRRFFSGQNQDHYEFLILDDSGRILEGTKSNFWAVRDGVLYTAGQGVLEGVTRKIVLSLLPDLGLGLRLEAIQRDEILELEEAAISGSSTAIMPVVNINGQRVGNGRPGPIFRSILECYRKYVARVIKTAVDLE